MIILENDFEIKCKKCGKKHTIEIDNFEEPETNSYERSMGYEYEYTWEYEFDCDKCNNEIMISIQGNEYPENILNFESLDNGHGLSYITKPSLKIDYHE